MRKISDETSVTRQVIDFVDEFPFIVYGLRKNLMNYSALARFIQRETDIKNFDAILVALRRYQKQIKSLQNGKEILAVLRKSKMVIRTGVNIYRLSEIDPDVPSIIKGLTHFSLIHDRRGNIELVTDEKVGLKPILTNLLEVEIKSPPELETTTGVINAMSSALAERGINILKHYYNENTTFFVFEKRDLTKVVDAFESIGIK